MNNIVRAWKDETYRQSLSVEEQAMLPASPAGEIELTEAQLEAVFGGWDECGEATGRRPVVPVRAREATNDIDQDVTQKAVATYSYARWSLVVCTATNKADLDAEIEKSRCY
jgi:mersacidin/lichenicidin family type 2 lantibiotic